MPTEPGTYIETLKVMLLLGAPHHAHNGSEENVQSGHPMHLTDVLDAITERLAECGSA